MKKRTIKNFLFAIAIFVTAVHAELSSADGGGATMDAAGISSTFTGLATVTCKSDGSIATDYLIAQIRDHSPPVNGLLVNLQLLKGNKAISTTDNLSGDSGYSDSVSLRGGNGTYYMMVNKTDVGERTFDIVYHCMSDSGAHTVTEIGVLQFE